MPATKPAPALPALHDGRNDVIDAFRAFAIFSVLLFHYLRRWPELYGYDAAYSPLLDIGRYGVHIFFIISGFVISMTVLRCRGAGEFLFKRFARLYPAYFVACTVIFIAMRLWGPEIFKVSFRDYLLNLPLLAKDLKVELVDGPFWTLVVEAKFYLFIALSYALLKERFWIGMAVIGAVGGVGIMRGALINEYLPYFLIGISFYMLLMKKDRIAAAVTGLLGLALYIEYADRLAMGGFAHLYILGSALVMFVLLARWPRLNFGPVAALGRMSYALYLVHLGIGVTIIALLKTRLHAPDEIAWGSAMLVALLLGFLLHQAVEKPGQKTLLAWWKNRHAKTA